MPRYQMDLWKIDWGNKHLHTYSCNLEEIVCIMKAKENSIYIQEKSHGVFSL